jgi:TusA-related sulfurtransferase
MLPSRTLDSIQPLEVNPMAITCTMGERTDSPSDRPSETDIREVGDQFLRALAERDFSTLASCFDENARFRALVPSGLREATGGSGATSYFQLWFGSANRLDLLEGRVEAMADRQHMTWRFRVYREAGTQMIEQQAYTTVRNGRIAEIDLLCSGFRLEQLPAQPVHQDRDGAPFEVAAVLEGGEASCATLTPMIRAKLRELGSGQVLEIDTSEPSAEGDIVSWSNLTGNPLVAMREDGAQRRFYIRKK